MKTTFFNQFSPAQLRIGYERSLDGLRKCFERSLKTGKYNGRSSNFWQQQIFRYEKILNEL